MGPVQKGYAVSIAVHAAIFVALAVAGTIGGCRLRKQPLEIVDFTIAVDPSGVEEEPPPQPKPDVKPPPAPPKPDDIVQPKPKPKQKPKPEPKPKVDKQLPPEPKVEEKPPEPEPVEEQKPEPEPEPEPQDDFEVDDLDLPTAVEAPSLNPVGSVDMDPLMQVYLERLKQIIMSNFNPPSNLNVRRDVKTTVQFTVDRFGGITAITLKRSSGNKTWDHLSVRAVQISKVPELPPNFRAPSLVLHFNFTPN